MKIPLRVGNATTAIYARRKMRTQEKDNFCKRGADCNAVLLLIASVSQLKVMVVILCIPEEWYNIHTYERTISFGRSVYDTHTQESQETLERLFLVQKMV